MLTKVVIALVALTLLQFLLVFVLTHLGVVVLGSAGWFIWSHYENTHRA